MSLVSAKWKQRSLVNTGVISLGIACIGVYRIRRKRTVNVLNFLRKRELERS